MISRKVGAPGNHRLDPEKKAQFLDFFTHKDHDDFGPTLAHEYLTESGVSGMSVSSVRRVMIKNGLWHPKEIRELKVHPLRPRRSRIGELIQLDGSLHDWFEERAKMYTSGVHRYVFPF